MDSISNKTTDTSIKSWVQKEALRILERTKEKNHIILKTGYGPSAVPHLGTCMEVIRTLMIAKTLRKMTSKPVIVLSMSDDMDGMRKIPPHLPNQEMLKNYINTPLFRVPDPYGIEKSLSEMCTVHLKKLFKDLGYTYFEYKPTSNEIDFEYLKQSNVDIVIIRSHEIYKAGIFDKIVLKILENNQILLDIILPTLGEERRPNYSPFMPISPTTGKVLSDGVIEYLPKSGAVLVKENEKTYELPVTGGKCKLQWKFDFFVQWIGLEVDYEMSGKDIGIGTYPIAIEACKKLNYDPPVTMIYEMCLDSDGSKMSKTKGNGLSIESLLRYLGSSALKHFMFGYPKSAKKIGVQNMPTILDTYLEDLEKAYKDPENKMQNAIWYINCENEPISQISVNMALGMIQGFQLKDLNALINSLDKKLNNTEYKVIESMYHFYHEQFKPPHRLTPPDWLKTYTESIIIHLGGSEEELKSHLYNLGKEALAQEKVSDLRNWFELLYMCLFGTKSGPRLHSFFFRYGIKNSTKMLSEIWTV